MHTMFDVRINGRTYARFVYRMDAMTFANIIRAKAPASVIEIVDVRSRPLS